MTTKKMRHELLGELIHQYVDTWKGSHSLNWFGKEIEIPLVVEISEKGISQEQITEFESFLKRQKSVLKASEKALFNHYQTVCEEIREEMGITDENDPEVPILKHQSELQFLLTFQSVYISYGDPPFGLLFDCTWEPDLGIAVVIHQGKVLEVGPQDIIL